MSITEMGKSRAASIALAQCWHQSMAAASFKVQEVAFWDTWLRSLPPKQEHSGYVDEVLRRINCNKDDTVLDVGAGTGALSIPLAKRVRSVTALDHSEAMLETIVRSAAAERLNNIKTLCLDWTKAQLDIDFDQHDIVLVSRSLPTGEDILHCLNLISCAAKRTCYVTWKANGHNSLEEALCRQLDIPYHPFPDYTVLRDILISLGITPNVEIFATRSKRIFGSLEQAHIQIVRGRTINDVDRQASFKFLADNLQCENGSYMQLEEARWALISWPRS